MVFTFLSGWGKSKRRIFLGILKLYTSRVLWEHSYNIHMLSVAALVPNEELSGCDRNHVSQKPEIFTLWPFTEKSVLTSGLKRSRVTFLISSRVACKSRPADYNYVLFHDPSLYQI